MYTEPTDLPVLRSNVLVRIVAIPMTGLIPTVQSRECLDSDFSVHSPGVAESLLPLKEQRWMGWGASQKFWFPIPNSLFAFP